MIARPYVMLLLFGGLAAVFYRRHAPVPLAIAIALLCGTSVHGAILAAAIALGAAWHVVIRRDWPLNQSRSRYLVAAAITVLAGIMVVIIAHPAVDFGGEARFETIQLQHFTDLLNNTVTEPWIIGACLLLALSAFAVWSKEAIVFAVGVGGLFVFEGLVFFLPHHMGAIVIALIVSLWIAWPREERLTPVPAMAALILVALFSVQTVWAVTAWRHDFSEPYSGAKDAAVYLRQVGADRGRTFGAAYEVVAIQAYFDHNIFANWPTAYVAFTKGWQDTVGTLDPHVPYEYVVVPVLHGDEDPYSFEIQRRGYFPVHVSPGRVFFRQGIWVTETYVIYRRSF